MEAQRVISAAKLKSGTEFRHDSYVKLIRTHNTNKHLPLYMCIYINIYSYISRCSVCVYIYTSTSYVMLYTAMHRIPGRCAPALNASCHSPQPRSCTSLGISNSFSVTPSEPKRRRGPWSSYSQQSHKQPHHRVQSTQLYGIQGFHIRNRNSGFG